MEKDGVCERCKLEKQECYTYVYCNTCRDYLKNEENKKEDIINKPNHYHKGVQPIEVIETNFEELETNGFLKGNVIKYVCRSNKKGKELEDLKKAKWNLNRLIERLEK